MLLVTHYYHAHLPTHSELCGYLWGCIVVANTNTTFLMLGQDLLLDDAMKLAKWWQRHKVIPIHKGEMGVLVTKAPARSPRGNVVYDVYLTKHNEVTE